ncbi:MAG: excinuclease ABC subunit A, partial [Thermoproteota archaeon]
MRKINNEIKITGARENNLKNINLNIPLNKLICICGPSGSGKTSLAFTTLYKESKRRFLNSFPNQLKFFSDKPTSVDVDEIFPVLPVFALPQINPIVGARSSMADIMRLTEGLQNLFYALSKEVCPTHKLELIGDDIISHLETEIASDTEKIHILLEKETFTELYPEGPYPLRSLFRKKMREFNSSDKLWELGRIKSNNVAKIKKILDGKINNRKVYFWFEDQKKKTVFDQSIKKRCPKAKVDKCQTQSMEKKLYFFSPYNALGACHNCSGYGAILVYDREKMVDSNLSIDEGAVKFINFKNFRPQIPNLEAALKKNKLSTTKPVKELGEKFWEILEKGDGSYKGFNHFYKYLERKQYKTNVRVYIRKYKKEIECTNCSGGRLSKPSQSFSVLIEDKFYTLNDFSKMSINDCYTLLKKLKPKKIELKKILNNLFEILEVADNIGLDHLKINRKSKSLSPSEYQRLLLVKYLSYEGTGALFVFDEPSLGLSIDEQKKMLTAFHKLIKQNNTVLLIEHSEFLIKSSDHIIEMGPRSGHLGGELMFEGNTKSYLKNKSKEKYSEVEIVKNKTKDKFCLKKANIFELDKKIIEFSSEQVIWVNGKSGSGKTAFLINIMANEIKYQLTREYFNIPKGSFDKLTFPKSLEEVIVINSNLNRFSSRSTIGSFTDLATPLRRHFAKLKVSKVLDFTPGHFSPNSKSGQCSFCEGKGKTVVEMQYLEDIVLSCEYCKGKKLKAEICGIRDNKFSIVEAYETPIKEIFKHIPLTPKYKKILKYMETLNLDYLTLERSVSTLSGGEKQRIYLLSKLINKVENSLIV